MLQEYSENEREGKKKKHAKGGLSLCSVDTEGRESAEEMNVGKCYKKCMQQKLWKDALRCQ